MEPISTMTLRRCYKATVNEPETITEAQPFCSVRSRSETSELRASGFRFPVAPLIERS
jgi:hypothetical protein